MRESVKVADGKATAILKATESAKLDRGNYALSATLEQHQDAPVFAAVRMLGKQFYNPSTMPPNIQPGDEIIITDLSRVQPADAISEGSVKGKWWRRPYRVPGQSEQQLMLCVEESDLEDPQSCVATPLAVPLKLDGWYEVWVRTYRHSVGGGVDVRLSGEKYFQHADPLQLEWPTNSDPRNGHFVDVRYRAADLTGQHLVIQQPYGTFDSETKMANASFAGVRLVKLSETKVAEIKANRKRDDVKIVGYDNDGFSYFWQWAVHDPAFVARLMEPLRDQSAGFLTMSLGGLGGIIIPTPYTEVYQINGHTRVGDYRANTFFRWCFEQNVNIVDVLAERADEVDLKIFVALMTERCFSPDKFYREHEDWQIHRGPGTGEGWDYALPTCRTSR